MRYDTLSKQLEEVKPEESRRGLQAWLMQSSEVPMVQEKKRGRPQRLSTQMLCLGILLCLLRGWRSQLDLWRQISLTGVGAFAPVPLSDQAIYKRLAQQTAEHLHAFFEHLSLWLREQQGLHEDRRLAPFATAVLALDESTLDPKKRWIAELRSLPKGDRGLLAGRIAALFDVRWQQWKHIEVFANVADCTRAARSMLSYVPTGALLLFDRGYNAFEWFDELTQRQIWWIGRIKKKMSYQVLHVICDHNGVVDCLIQIGAYRADRARYTARLVSYWYRGTRYQYLTNVTDPHLLSVAQIAHLYDRRWDIECAFRLLKQHLGLKWLWSAKWEVIQVQIWATALLAQVFFAYQLQIAIQADVDVFDVSLELLVRHVPDLLAQGRDPIATIVKQGRDLRIIRPHHRTYREILHVPVEALCDPPADFLWQRQPRYAHKADGRKSKYKALS
jgi:Transposase DDE domain